MYGWGRILNKQTCNHFKYPFNIQYSVAANGPNKSRYRVNQQFNSLFYKIIFQGNHGCCGAILKNNFKGETSKMRLCCPDDERKYVQCTHMNNCLMLTLVIIPTLF